MDALRAVTRLESIHRLDLHYDRVFHKEVGQVIADDGSAIPDLHRLLLPRPEAGRLPGPHRGPRFSAVRPRVWQGA